MTVMPLFTSCPGTELQALRPFGIFPFLMSSSVPDTSVILLMKNATSISVSVFRKIITPAGDTVNSFGENDKSNGVKVLQPLTIYAICDKIRPLRV